MSDTHETITDIIAEKRRQADKIERDCAEKMKRGEMISDQYARELVADIRREADRLEAAWKRERGDCAKLREALSDACYAMFNFLKAQNGGYEEMANALDKAKAALAAPPRNCDKYATADEALKAQEQMFNDSNFANGECKLGCPECDNPRVGCKIAWLFAPATEKEGGAE